MACFQGAQNQGVSPWVPPLPLDTFRGWTLFVALWVPCFRWNFSVVKVLVRTIWGIFWLSTTEATKKNSRGVCQLWEGEWDDHQGLVMDQQFLGSRRVLACGCESHTSMVWACAGWGESVGLGGWKLVRWTWQVAEATAELRIDRHKPKQSWKHQGRGLEVWGATWRVWRSIHTTSPESSGPTPKDKFRLMSGISLLLREKRAPQKSIKIDQTWSKSMKIDQIWWKLIKNDQQKNGKSPGKNRPKTMKPQKRKISGRSSCQTSKEAFLNPANRQQLSSFSTAVFL